jgi:hypothetical protein
MFSDIILIWKRVCVCEQTAMFNSTYHIGCKLQQRIRLSYEFFFFLFFSKLTIHESVSYHSTLKLLWAWKRYCQPICYVARRRKTFHLFFGELDSPFHFHWWFSNWEKKSFLLSRIKTPVNWSRTRIVSR